MINIYRNHSLLNNNTFNVDVKSDYFVAPSTKSEVQEVVLDKKYKNISKLILGCGSNILFTKDFKGMVILPEIKNIEIISDKEDYVIVKVGAGEVWDEFVDWAVKNDFGGVENLSIIPGRVGACPVQNIGAYGVEVMNVIVSVDAIEIETGKDKVFTNTDCKFAYRNSIFKNELQGKYIITEVSFKLTKKHIFNLKYGNIQDELKELDNVNLKAIREAVINIRERKLPNPDENPNAGSFFKNPAVTYHEYAKLLKEFPDIVAYKINDNEYKLAAGWLIDKSGLKGKIQGRVSVHNKQALVIVNHDNATGKEIIELAEYVKETVLNMFGVNLEIEVNVY